MTVNLNVKKCRAFPNVDHLKNTKFQLWTKWGGVIPANNYSSSGQ